MAGDFDELDSEREAADQAALEKAMAILSGRFDAVTVLVTNFDGATGNTVSAWRGRGNWHARHGQVREWLTKREAEARAEAVSAMGDGNEWS